MPALADTEARSSVTRLCSPTPSAFSTADRIALACNCPPRPASIRPHQSRRPAGALVPRARRSIPQGADRCPRRGPAGAQANLRGGEGASHQRAAGVRQIEVDLRNTEILSPVSGRGPAQCRARQPWQPSLQAPTCSIADDLRHMESPQHTDANRCRPHHAGQASQLTVTAYPGRTFEARSSRCGWDRRMCRTS